MSRKLKPFREHFIEQRGNESGMSDDEVDDFNVYKNENNNVIEYGEDGTEATFVDNEDFLHAGVKVLKNAFISANTNHMQEKAVLKTLREYPFSLTYLPKDFRNAGRVKKPKRFQTTSVEENAAYWRTNVKSNNVHDKLLKFRVKYGMNVNNKQVLTDETWSKSLPSNLPSCSKTPASDVMEFRGHHVNTSNKQALTDETWSKSLPSNLPSCSKTSDNDVIVFRGHHVNTNNKQVLTSETWRKSSRSNSPSCSKTPDNNVMVFGGNHINTNNRQVLTDENWSKSRLSNSPSCLKTPGNVMVFRGNHINTNNKQVLTNETWRKSSPSNSSSCLKTPGNDVILSKEHHININNKQASTSETWSRFPLSSSPAICRCSLQDVIGQLVELKAMVGDLQNQVGQLNAQLIEERDHCFQETFLQPIEGFPITSLRDFIQFESDESKEQRKKMLNHLVTLGAMKLRDFISMSIKECMTDKLINDFTWLGSNNTQRLGNSKLCNIIYEAAKRCSHFPGPTSKTEFKSEVSEVLRAIKQRYRNRMKKKRTEVDDMCYFDDDEFEEEICKIEEDDYNEDNL